jgi:hypothetical protein
MEDEVSEVDNDTQVGGDCPTFLVATTAQIPWTLIIAVAVESTTDCQLVVYFVYDIELK